MVEYRTINTIIKTVFLLFPLYSAIRIAVYRIAPNITSIWFILIHLCFLEPNLDISLVEIVVEEIAIYTISELLKVKMICSKNLSNDSEIRTYRITDVTGINEIIIE